MTTQINGDGANPQSTAGYTYIDTDGPHPNTQYLIASSTNTTPIEIVWAAPVPFNDQDTIEIEGHHTNTAANGVWQYTKIDTTHGTLNGSTPTAAGGATGAGFDWSINPLLTVPEDLVDDVDAITVNPAFEGLFDLAPYMYRRMGAYSLIDYRQRQDGSLFTTFSTTALNASTWTDLGVTTLAGKRWLHYGDLLEVTFTSALSTASGAGVAVTFGLNLDGGGATAQVPFACEFLPSASGVVVPMVMRGIYTHGNAGFPDQAYVISIMGIANTATPNLFLSGTNQLTIRHYRPNI